MANERGRSCHVVGDWPHAAANQARGAQQNDTSYECDTADKVCIMGYAA